MSAIYLDLQRAEDTRDIVHQAVAALSAGKIVAFPTETVYGLAASGLVPEAVDRLWQIKGRNPGKPIAFAVKSVDAALDYVPDMTPLAKRLARRCWPGPVTLVLDCCHRDSVINRLHSIVRQATVPDQTVGLRVPANDKTLQIMQLCAGPILLTSANFSGQGEAKTGVEVMQRVGDKVDLVLDDGPCRIGQASTVVQVTADGYNILREGVVDKATLDNLSGFLALVVCTGNTCRSPMGEALLRKQIAHQLGCAPLELEGMGIHVLSAGISAMPGAPAAEQAILVMEEMGMQITDHQSQPVTHRLAQYADVILTMTESHRQAVISQWPAVESRTFTISMDGNDISDPIGSPIEVYRQCAQQIEEQMARWVSKLDLSQYKGKT
jgi:tRNA threonylcarbamoyl adenosine modification protein (Sua5/YciO/YrdC/YwlC family)